MYGVFLSTTSQTNAGSGVANAPAFDTTLLSNGVTMTGSRITVAYSGVFLISFESKFSNSTGSNVVIDVWLAINGTNVAGSDQQVQTTGTVISASWTYEQYLNAGDYFQILWSCTSTNVSMVALGTQTAPTRPSSPSIYVSVSQITNYGQTGPQGATGATGAQATVLGRIVTSVNYTGLSSDTIIAVTGYSSPVSIYLPQSNTLPVGKFYVVVDEGRSASINNIQIVPFTGNLISGSSSIYITQNYEAISLYSYTNGWFIY